MPRVVLVVVLVLVAVGIAAVIRSRTARPAPVRTGTVSPRLLSAVAVVSLQYR